MRLLRAASDQRLVGLVRGGSESAFEAIFERHHRGLLSFCAGMLGNQAEAEDAVQQTFLSAYRDLLRSDQEIALRPWLYTIARNRCLSTIRAHRERPSEQLDERPSASGVATQVADREEVREIVEDLHRLPEDQRAALVLSELGDLTHEQIGDVLECRTDKVKALVFQARRALAGAREARAIPCSEIRTELATAKGPELRRAHLRRHIAGCGSCRAFGDEVGRQHRALQLALPVVPTATLKADSLPWVGAGGMGFAGASAAAAGGITGGTGLAGLGAGGVLKLALAGALAVGGVAATEVVREGSGARDVAPAASSRQAPGDRPEADPAGSPVSSHAAAAASQGHGSAISSDIGGIGATGAAAGAASSTGLAASAVAGTGSANAHGANPNAGFGQSQGQGHGQGAGQGQGEANGSAQGQGKDKGKGAKPDGNQGNGSSANAGAEAPGRTEENAGGSNAGGNSKSQKGGKASDAEDEVAATEPAERAAG